MTENASPPIGERLAICRSALCEGRLVEARLLLDEIGARPYELFQAGLPIASAESYGVPVEWRGLFQDRIDWVNYCIRYAGEGYRGGAA